MSTPRQIGQNVTYRNRMMNQRSKSKRIGWWFFVVWTVLSGLFVGWGMPLFAVPTMGQIMLLLELTAFGFVAAFGVTLLAEIWSPLIRGHRRD